MLQFLLEAVKFHKEKIAQKLKEIEIKEPTLPWKVVDLEEVKGCRIAAEDGSYNYREMRNFAFYVVASQVFFLDKKLDCLRSCDMDLLIPYKNVEERVKFYMYILESRISLKAISEFSPAIFLIDGSLLSILGKQLSFSSLPPKDVRRKLDKRYAKILEKSVEAGEMGILSKRLWKEVKESFQEVAAQAMFYLEFLEHVIAFRKLLEKGKGKIVAVAKTSQASDYFKTGFPDIAIFERYTKGEGYSEPLIVDPPQSKILESRKLHKMKISIFYARLKHFSNVLKFEILGKVDEEQVKDLLRRVKGICVDGYPYLLKKAHSETTIKDKDIERLMKVFGLIGKSGREMLD